MATSKDPETCVGVFWGAAIKLLGPLVIIVAAITPYSVRAETLPAGEGCQPGTHPVDCLVVQAYFGFIECDLELQVAAFKVSHPDDLVPILAECEKQRAVDVESAYRAAAAALAGKESGLALAKDLYAFWQASMPLLLPREEPKAARKKRIDERKAEMNYKGNRLKLEK